MNFTEVELQGLQSKNTTFRGEEAFLTFYPESEYAPNTPRTSMTPLGLYLFTQGFSLDEAHGYLPPVQAIGKDTQNLRVAEVMESRLSVSGLLTQSESDLAWIKPGHVPILCFIDFIDESPDMNPDAVDNVLDALHRVNQTLVVRNLRLTSKRVSSADASGTQFSLDFTGGLVERLANDTQDASGSVVLPPEPVYTGGSIPPYPTAGAMGFGTRFGVFFGG